MLQSIFACSQEQPNHSRYCIRKSFPMRTREIWTNWHCDGLYWQCYIQDFAQPIDITLHWNQHYLKYEYTYISVSIVSDLRDQHRRLVDRRLEMSWWGYAIVITIILILSMHSFAVYARLAQSWKKLEMTTMIDQRGPSIQFQML